MPLCLRMICMILEQCAVWPYLLRTCPFVPPPLFHAPAPPPLPTKDKHFLHMQL
jgi:hypothetical protein